MGGPSQAQHAALASLAAIADKPHADEFYVELGIADASRVPVATARSLYARGWATEVVPIGGYELRDRPGAWMRITDEGREVLAASRAARVEAGLTLADPSIPRRRGGSRFRFGEGQR